MSNNKAEILKAMKADSLTDRLHGQDDYGIIFEDTIPFSLNDKDYEQLVRLGLLDYNALDEEIKVFNNTDDFGNAYDMVHSSVTGVLDTLYSVIKDISDGMSDTDIQKLPASARTMVENYREFEKADRDIAKTTKDKSNMER